MKSLHNVLILVVCSLLLFQCKNALPTESIDPNVVTFSDINFETLIRETLNKPSGGITKSDMLTITQLEGWNKGVNNIDGIEHCINLEYLNLWENQIIDISDLAGLTNLTILILPDNQINDISILVDLINIETLDLASNQISDISALSGLANLYEIILDDNQISDIVPLVQNQEIATDDRVELRSNPLSEASINTYIQQLQARGVDID